jgi:hypothetical protein
MKWQLSLLSTSLLTCLLASPAAADDLPSAGPVPPPAAIASALDQPSWSAECCACLGNSRNGPINGNHDFPNFINWMSNPLQNIDPRSMTAIYPLFMNQWTSAIPPVPRGDFQVYGPAITVALSDRLAFGLNQGGYAVENFTPSARQLQRLIALDPTGRFREIETDHERNGWLNLGGFVQYTVIADACNQFLMTGGLRWETPAGSYEIFQGHGPVHLAPYITLGKEFGNWHVLTETGYQFPAGSGSDTTNIFYANLHIDRQCFGWLYPLVEFNSLFHTTNISFGLPTRRGFIDFGNFESTGDVVSLAAGLNAVLIRERLEIGAVYTTVISAQHDFNANGLLVKMTFRF